MSPVDFDALSRAYGRIRGLPDFHPGDRIWWFYLREAVQRWLERHEDADLRNALNGVKEFPEKLPDENSRWLDLRQAVENVLERQSEV